MSLSIDVLNVKYKFVYNKGGYEIHNYQSNNIHTILIVGNPKPVLASLTICIVQRKLHINQN